MCTIYHMVESYTVELKRSPYINIKDGLPVWTLVVEVGFEAVLIAAWEAAAAVAVAIAPIVVAPLPLLLGASNLLHQSLSQSANSQGSDTSEAISHGGSSIAVIQLPKNPQITRQLEFFELYLHTGRAKKAYIIKATKVC